ncbi:MAG: diguanylate cyclase [Rhodocyclaceae bacterium]
MSFLGPASRLAFGVLGLMMSLFLLVDLFADVVPDRADTAARLRGRLSESLAVQVTALVQADQREALDRTLKQVLERDKEIVSIGVRSRDEHLVALAGPHLAVWTLPDGERSTLTQVRVPILEGGAPWGETEIVFRPVLPTTFFGWLADPMVRAVALGILLGFPLLYLYLRRALQYLDPGSVIPQRVRVAFDTLGEGVVILDTEARIMMTNKVFKALHPQAAGDLTGRIISNLPWLVAGFGADKDGYPWHRAMKTRGEQSDVPLELSLPGSSEPLRLLVGAAAIEDGGARLRGCMVSFKNVTALHLANTQLLATVAELDRSQEQIKAQNAELARLATRDPLTGCLNRRAFFEGADALFADVPGGTRRISCIMSDIDHFKEFNDRYGHAVGDQVLQAVARSLTSGVRGGDLLCRYGGEEFCVLLPGLDAAQAASIAERLRSDIERHAGPSVRTSVGLTVTSSFGVAELRPGVGDPAALIDEADKALYMSKRSGRNRVTVSDGTAA